jgi:hypothetical protein
MQQQLNDVTVKIFRYFNRHFKDVEDRLKKQDSHIEGIYQLIDSYLKQAETINQDSVLGDKRLQRLEEQIVRINRQARSRVVSQ